MKLYTIVIATLLPVALHGAAQITNPQALAHHQASSSTYTPPLDTQKLLLCEGQQTIPPIIDSLLPTHIQCANLRGAGNNKNIMSHDGSTITIDNRIYTRNASGIYTLRHIPEGYPNIETINSDGSYIATHNNKDDTAKIYARNQHGNYVLASTHPLHRYERLQTISNDGSIFSTQDKSSNTPTVTIYARNSDGNYLPCHTAPATNPNAVLTMSANCSTYGFNYAHENRAHVYTRTSQGVYQPCHTTPTNTRERITHINTDGSIFSSQKCVGLGPHAIYKRDSEGSYVPCQIVLTKDEPGDVVLFEAPTLSADGSTFCINKNLQQKDTMGRKSITVYESSPAGIYLPRYTTPKRVCEELSCMNADGSMFSIEDPKEQTSRLYKRAQDGTYQLRYTTPAKILNIGTDSTFTSYTFPKKWDSPHITMLYTSLHDPKPTQLDLLASLTHPEIRERIFRLNETQSKIWQSLPITLRNTLMHLRNIRVLTPASQAHAHALARLK